MSDKINDAIVATVDIDQHFKNPPTNEHEQDTLSLESDLWGGMSSNEEEEEGDDDDGHVNDDSESSRENQSESGDHDEFDPNVDPQDMSDYELEDRLRCGWGDPEPLVAEMTIRQKRRRRYEDAALNGEVVLELQERVNIQALRYLLRSAKLEVDHKNKLRMYAQEMDSSSFSKRVRYAVGKGHEEIPTGRLYAQSASLQTLPRPLRHTLARGVYHDVDMVNSHPSLLLQLCKQKSWPHVRLKQYIENRDELIADAMQEFGVNRKVAKQLFLTLMNGGTLKNWMEANNSNYTNNKNAPPKSLKRFEKEMWTIREKVWEDQQYTQHREVATQRCAEKGDKHIDPKASGVTEKTHYKDPKASCLSEVLGEIENGLLMKIASFFRSRGWEIGVYVLDGLMLYQRHEDVSVRSIECGDECGDDIYSHSERRLENDLRDCEVAVASEGTWTIQLNVKPFDECIESAVASSQPSFGVIGSCSHMEVLNWRTQYSRALLNCLSRETCDREAANISFVRTKLGLMPQPQQPLEEVAADDEAQKTCDDTAGNDWVDALTVLEDLAVHDNPDAYLRLRPFQDLQCPFTLDDLLQATSEQAVRFLAPKVIGRIIGSSNEQWVKKIRNTKCTGNANTYKFVVMGDNLAILKGYVASEFEERDQRITDLVVDIAQRRGKEMNYQEMDFFPYAPEQRSSLAALDSGVLNSFGGFPFTEMHGLTFEEIDWTPIQPILDFMKTVLCDANDDGSPNADKKISELWIFIQSWFADILQNPGRKPRVCLVLYSKQQQVGKGFLVRAICQLLVGRYFNQVDDEKHILGDFTSKLANHFVLAIDESERRGVSHQLSGKLKNRITEPTCSVTRKGVDPIDIHSVHRYIYCINWLDALDIELFDQRFCISQCNPVFQGCKEKFEMIDCLIKEHAKLLWNYFKKFPLDKYWNQTIPMTPVKRSAIELRYPTPVQFVVSSPRFWDGQEEYKETTEIRWHWDELYSLYRQWARANEIEYGIVRTAEALKPHLQLVNIHPASDRGRIKIAKSRKTGFSISKEQLVLSIRQFLTKMGDQGAEDWEPPRTGDDESGGGGGGDDDGDDDT